MIKTNLLIISVATLSQPLFSPVMAADFSLLAGGQFGGQFERNQAPYERLDLDSAPAFSAALDWSIGQRQLLGLYVSHQPTEIENLPGVNSQLSVNYLHLTGTRYFYYKGFVTYVTGGVGATLLYPDSSQYEKDYHFSINLGGGYAYPLTDNVFLKLEGRVFNSFIKEHAEFFCSGGCTVRVSSTLWSQLQISAGLMARF